MGIVLAQTTEFEFGTAGVVGAVIGALISIFLAYKCAKNERWLLFVLGFLCGILWIVGWAMGPKRASQRY